MIRESRVMSILPAETKTPSFFPTHEIFLFRMAAVATAPALSVSAFSFSRSKGIAIAIPPTLHPGHACERRGFHKPCRRTATGSRVGSTSFCVHPHASVSPPTFRPPHLLSDCIVKERRSLPYPCSTCPRACPPSESPRGGDWAKAAAGVVFTSSGLNETFLGGIAMPVTLKTISLWRKEVENQVGTLAHTLAPVAKAGENLNALMGIAIGRRNKGRN